MAAGGGCGYLLVFEGELLDGSMSGIRAQRMLTSRMSETLPIPILDKWYKSLWEAGQRETLIVGLETGGNCLVGYLALLTEAMWKAVIHMLSSHRRSSP